MPSRDDLLKLRLGWPLPAGQGNLFGARDGQFPGRGIHGQCRAGTQRGTLTDSYRCHQLRVRTDEYVILDDRLMFVGTVVIAGDGAWPTVASPI